MKSKMVRQLIAVSLAAAMTAGLAACGNSASESANVSEGSAAPAESAAEAQESQAEPASVAEEEEAGEDGYTVLTDENGDVIDLGGMEVIMRDWWTAEENGDEEKSAYDEAKDEYWEWCQETYNFKFKRMAISDYTSTPEDFVNYATTGGDENYLFVLRAGSELASAMNNGLLFDLSTLDCLDFTEEKWKCGTHEWMSKEDSIYGMSGDFCEPKGGIYFNKRLLEEAGINPDDIYTYQENMEWTWDKFEELCKKVAADTDNDGVIDRYAMANFTSLLYPLAVYSNGGDFIGKDEEGKLYNALESDATLEALNWALDMLDKYEMTYPEDANWDYWLTAYKNGEACFMADEAYRAGQMAEMEDDFGFVCFPMGPRATDYTNIWNNNPVCIPACYDAEKAWKLAFVYNLYTDPVPGYEDYQVWKNEYLKTFRDTEAIELTIARLMENGRVTYHTMVPGLDLGPDLIWGLSKENTPAQQAETIRPTWESYLADVNK